MESIKKLYDNFVFNLSNVFRSQLNGSCLVYNAPMGALLAIHGVSNVKVCAVASATNYWFSYNGTNFYAQEPNTHFEPDSMMLCYGQSQDSTLICHPYSQDLFSCANHAENFLKLSTIINNQQK